MSLLESINSFIWGVPVISLILLTGVILSVRSRFLQIRLLPLSVKFFIKEVMQSEKNENSVSGYRALCTALAATVGTGNIAGVAGAIAIGGPGAIFWMWVCAILGMITKFAEVALSVHYREKDSSGGYVGGPMYIIKNGLHRRYHVLSYVYCFFGVVAALGIGNAVQINAVIDGAEMIAQTANVVFTTKHRLLIGILICVLMIPIFKKGAPQIGKIAEVLVPIAAIFYILMAIIVLCVRCEEIPVAIAEIMQGAFSPSAVTGGALGSFLSTLRVGASRGVFTNEAGMGTASIAHAASNVKHPAEQGLMGILEVFIDTILICTITGLVILCSDVQIPYGLDSGIVLSFDAFSSVLGNWSSIVLAILVCILAFATILGWGLYGARCCQYLLGYKSWSMFMYVQSVAVLLGAVLNTSVVWTLAEIVNGLMAIPNLFAISALSSVAISIMNDFQKKKNAYRLH